MSLNKYESFTVWNEFYDCSKCSQKDSCMNARIRGYG